MCPKQSANRADIFPSYLTRFKHMGRLGYFMDKDCFHVALC